jgi:formamidopyrimidine-DNA glycosylase
VPELPEVETIARELAPLVVGATISGVWTDWPRAIRYPEPGEFARRIVGREILAVGRRAKWLVLSLSGDMVLAIQVKMTGQLFVLQAGTVHDRHVHLRFELADGRWILFRDVRKFGRVGLYRRDEVGAILGPDDEGELFGKHGPEPLSDEFTLRVFRERLRRRKGRLKALLLDQAFIAGVGNIYADEALWRARLHPLRSAATLRPSDERRLYLGLRSVLTEAIERRGSSIDDYTAPEGDGEMQDFLDVYQRTGSPCPRCGRPVRRIVLGQRGTHFCSWCQRLPAADRTPGNLQLLKAAVSKTRRGPRWSELPSGDGAVGARPNRGPGSLRL